MGCCLSIPNGTVYFYHLSVTASKQGNVPSGARILCVMCGEKKKSSAGCTSFRMADGGLGLPSSVGHRRDIGGNPPGK